MPPWPHEEHIQSETGQNPFRTRHGLDGQFVIMYSGNHSPSNPLKTLLDAAVQLKDDPNLKFVFVGGGSGKKEVESAIHDHNLIHTISLPYQPLSELKYSLTAADVHIVSLGETMVGIIHPCKIYGAMTAGKPILFLGPRPSHISDLLDQHDIGFQVSHGNIQAAIDVITLMRAMPSQDLQGMGQRARELLNESLSQRLLCGKFCDAVETAFGTQAKARM
jgi:colanic acid biosynthesis glycosyl transferase WcaI